MTTKQIIVSGLVLIVGLIFLAGWQAAPVRENNPGLAYGADLEKCRSAGENPLTGTNWQECEAVAQKIIAETRGSDDPEIQSLQVQIEDLLKQISDLQGR